MEYAMGTKGSHLIATLRPTVVTEKLVADVVDNLELRCRGRGWRELNAAAESFVINLLRAWRLGVPLVFSRRHKATTDGVHSGLYLATVADAMEKVGLITQRMGWFPYDHPLRKGRRSEAEASDLLVRLFKKTINGAAYGSTVSNLRKDGIYIDGTYGYTNNGLWYDSISSDCKYGYTDNGLKYDSVRESIGILHGGRIDAEPHVDTADSQIILPPLWSRPSPRHLVKLRDAKRQWIPYKGDDRTRQMRLELEAVNRLAGASVVAHVGGDGLGIPLATDLHRVFNRESWDQGGRFYGADHICLKGGGDARSRILIDGEPVVELDYSGLHIRLLYNLAGLPLDGDPYDLRLYDDSYFVHVERSIDLRKLAKITCLISINAKKGRGQAIFAICKHIAQTENIPMPPMNLVAPLVRRFELAHHPIKQHFFSGAGLRLQAVDSRIAARVLRYFTDRDVVCLPVHDSFIVQVRFGDELRDVMEWAYRQEVNGFNPVIK